MINNFFTLYRQVGEFSPFLEGAKLISCFSQMKDTLHMEWVTRDRQVVTLEISAQPAFPYWLIRESLSRKKKNTIDVFSSLTGGRLREIGIIPFDRVIWLVFENSEYVVIELFGTPNVYRLNPEGMILETFENPNQWAGKAYPFFQKIRETAVRHPELIHDDSAVEELKTRLSKGYLSFNKTLYLEWLFRSSGGNYREALNEMFGELKSAKPRIYSRNGEPFLFSIAELLHLSETGKPPEMETFGTVNDAARQYVRLKQRAEQDVSRRNTLSKASSQRIRKNELLIAALTNDMKKAGQYREWENKGHLLSAHYTQIRKGLDSISLTDPEHPGDAPVIIALNPDLTPHENIAAMYAKSKKMKHSVERIRLRIHEIERENVYIDSVCVKMESLPPPNGDSLEKIYLDFARRKWIKAETISSKSAKTVLSGDELFKSFVLEKRWKVWVGQNDQKNEQLTFGYAAKDDYWFHARGVPGSHVILRKEQRSENPPKSVIEAAAGIAAHFSKAKTSALVPVIMTRKKYVRKMKHGRPGQVIVEREKVIMIEPKNPENGKDY